MKLDQAGRRPLLDEQGHLPGRAFASKNMPKADERTAPTMGAARVGAGCGRSKSPSSGQHTGIIRFFRFFFFFFFFETNGGRFHPGRPGQSFGPSRGTGSSATLINCSGSRVGDGLSGAPTAGPAVRLNTNLAPKPGPAENIAPRRRGRYDLLALILPRGDLVVRGTFGTQIHRRPMPVRSPSYMRVFRKSCETLEIENSAPQAGAGAQNWVERCCDRPRNVEELHQQTAQDGRPSLSQFPNMSVAV